MPLLGLLDPSRGAFLWGAWGYTVTHGGQIRLFGQGMFAPGQGVLPKFTSGVHGNMIISKGLANTAGMVPRVFNAREVVYINPVR